MKLRLDLFRADTGWLIEKLGLYLNTMESSIEISRRIDDERISQIEIDSEFDLGLQQEELHVHRLLFEDDFPSKLRYSFLVLSYIVFESRCKALVKELNRRDIVKNVQMEKKGDESLVDSMRRFLEMQPHKITCVSGTVWTELSDLKALRSCIVHGSGDVKNWNQRQRIMQLIHKNNSKGLLLNEEGFVQIDTVYCRHVIKVIESFFSSIFEKTGFGPEQTVVV